MSISAAIYLLSAGAQLVLGVVSASRLGRSRLAIALAALCAVMSSWMAAEALHLHTHAVTWDRLGMSLSILAIPLALEVVLRFVGQRTARAALAWIIWVPALALAAATTASLSVAPLARWAPSVAWAGASGALGAFSAIAEVVLLVAHRRRERDADERARTDLILLAVCLQTFSALLELGPLLGIGRLDLAAGGYLLGTSVTALAAFRIDRDTQKQNGLALIGISVFAALVVIALALSGRTSSAPAVVTAVLVSILFGVVASAATAYARLERERRARAERTGNVGLFAQQMAHDLKNPLAAMRGATEFLLEERAEGRSIDEHTEMLTLMKEQVDRIRRKIDEYARLARVEPILSEHDVADAVRTVLRLQKFAANGDVRVEATYESGVARCRLDVDLFTAALDNVLTNAMESIAAGGLISVRVSRYDSRDADAALCIEVRDTGAGMDARMLERISASRAGFTTKSTGTGLGLPFVRRVVEAHGGTLKIDSALGVGTIVRMVLPPVTPSASESRP